MLKHPISLGDSRMNGFVPSKNPEKARQFYEGILGFALASDNEYVATYRAGSTTIMLQKMGADFAPLPRTILGWEVSGIRNVVMDLTERGVTFERVAWVEQDDLGIWNSSDGQVAWFKDPDGNMLSVSEH